LAIRCHPCVRAETGDVQAWLEREVSHVRLGLPDTALRLLRLTQQLPSGERAVGWLVEIDAGDAEGGVDPRRLATIVRDMRLLGLKPTLLSSYTGATSIRQPAS
jgi:hypothetical protein